MFTQRATQPKSTAPSENGRRKVQTEATELNEEPPEDPDKTRDSEHKYR